LKQAKALIPILFILLLITTIIGLVWGSYRFAKYEVRGSDFSIQWIAIHSLVTAGESPFSERTNTLIQNSVHGQTGFTLGVTPKYTSPLYSGILLLPFALIWNKTLTYALWLTLQFIALFGVILLSMRLTGWQPAWFIFLPFSIFTIFSYHILMPWLDGGLPIWSALFLVSALLALSQNRNELAGIFMALSAIQPLMIILPLIFILLWAAIQKRKLLILWFFITILFISIVGIFLVPDWVIQYLRLLFNFQQNFPPGSPGYLFKLTWPGLGKQLGWLLSAALLFVLLAEWWLALKREFRWFVWTVCLTLVISQWIGIPTIPAYFVELILPMILISAMLAEHWKRAGNWTAVVFSMLVFVWEWVLFYRDITSRQSNLLLNLLIPLPLILFIGLYWVRWWAIKPRRLLVEEIKLSESY